MFDFPLYLQDIIRAAAEAGRRTGCERHDCAANSQGSNEEGDVRGMATGSRRRPVESVL